MSIVSIYLTLIPQQLGMIFQVGSPVHAARLNSRRSESKLTLHADVRTDVRVVQTVACGIIERLLK